MGSNTLNQELLDACRQVWRKGLKREKGLQHCAKVLGYKPLLSDYLEHFAFMFNNAPELN